MRCGIHVDPARTRRVHPRGTGRNNQQKSVRLKEFVARDRWLLARAEIQPRRNRMSTALLPSPPVCRLLLVRPSQPEGWHGTDERGLSAKTGQGTDRLEARAAHARTRRRCSWRLPRADDAQGSTSCAQAARDQGALLGRQEHAHEARRRGGGREGPARADRRADRDRLPGPRGRSGRRREGAERHRQDERRARDPRRHPRRKRRSPTRRSRGSRRCLPRMSCALSSRLRSSGR